MGKRGYIKWGVRLGEGLYYVGVGGVCGGWCVGVSVWVWWGVGGTYGCIIVIEVVGFTALMVAISTR